MRALNLTSLQLASIPLPKTVLIAFLGSLALALSAQVSIVLPFTVVPITGQTFAVMMMALCMGRKIACMAFLMYMAEGAMGLPVFAKASPLALVGPSIGYVIGMLMASYVVGLLSDLGAKKSFWLSLASCYIGSLFIFSFGVYGLSFFAPTESLFAIGVAPFLIGDFIKNTLASLIATRKFA